MKLKKIFYFLKSLVTKKKLNLIKDQEKIFSDNQLNYIEGQKKLKKVLQNIDLTKYNMASEHLKIFSSISLKDDTKNILEIGTYDGFNSLILNRLFPSALIDTLDLPESDNEFKNLYNRNIESKKKEFIQVRSNNINKNNKIKFFEKNSLDLIFENKKKYDLIWIDGFHGAPIVISDIINSIRLINSNGIILIDDIYLYGEAYSPYQSNAALKTLKSLKKANLIKYNLFYKRLDFKYNLNKYNQKFIALVTNVK